LFLRSSVWRETAENAAESLTKGMRVIASGFLKSRSYEKDGEKRSVTEFEIQEIGPSLKNASAKVVKAQKNNSSGGLGGQQHGGGFNATPAESDPWATPAVNPNNGGGWGNGPDSEPPF